MTRTRSADRRLLLAGVLALCCFAPAAAWSQDPRATAAQRVARDWLVLVDRGEASAAWKSASPLFRESVDEPGWSRILAATRGPRGLLNSRTLASTAFQSEAPGSAQKGEFVLLAYRSVFEKTPTTIEQVTVVHDGDGAWRVAGYALR